MIRLETIRFANLDEIRFETRIQSDNSDNGRRVKHFVYYDKALGAYIHEWIYLSSIEKPKLSENHFVSKRKFWGKVRFVGRREAFLCETWMALACSVVELEMLRKDNGNG